MSLGTKSESGNSSHEAYRLLSEINFEENARVLSIREDLQDTLDGKNTRSSPFLKFKGFSTE